MRTLNEAIDLTPYAAAVNGALAHRRPAFVATSAEDGTPDIGPKGSVFVADAGHLVYLEYTRGGHLANASTGKRNCLRQELGEMNSELE